MKVVEENYARSATTPTATVVFEAPTFEEVEVQFHHLVAIESNRLHTRKRHRQRYYVITLDDGRVVRPGQDGVPTDCYVERWNESAFGDVTPPQSPVDPGL